MMLLLEYGTETTRDVWKLALQTTFSVEIRRPDVRLIDHLQRHSPDIVFMSRATYLNLTTDERRLLSTTIILVGLERHEYATQYQIRGAGIVSLSIGFSEVTKAIKKLADGNIYISEEILTLSKRLTTTIEKLPQRRRQLFHLRSQGMTVADAAKQMSISKNTARNHDKATARFFHTRLSLSYDSVRQVYKMIQQTNNPISSDTVPPKKVESL